ncbi:ATP-binding protein [Streptomyces sp. NPDC058001]|uniref:ATP-binding protein n=1 Tax=Streptomyces sp. NPDC058001 TaxID=3346300 RepID=UPI0036EDF789
MDLYELRIENLFDEFTHAIPFNTIDGLTLLHSANGVGKTTVLKIIDALSNRRFSMLRSIHFPGLQARFSNGETLAVKRNIDQTREKTSLEFRLTDDEDRLVHPPWTLGQSAIDLGIPKTMIEDVIHELNQTGANEWFDMVTGENLDLNGVLDRYGERLSQYSPGPSRAKNPDWLRSLTARFPVFFIRTERLTSGSHDRPTKYRPNREVTAWFCATGPNQDRYQEGGGRRQSPARSRAVGGLVVLVLSSAPTDATVCRRTGASPDLPTEPRGRFHSALRTVDELYAAAGLSRWALSDSYHSCSQVIPRRDFRQFTLSRQRHSSEHCAVAEEAL